MLVLDNSTAPLPILAASGTVTVIQATQGDLPTVMVILEEAAKRLLSRGIHQWSVPAPPGLWLRMAEEVAARRVYLLYQSTGDQATAIGTFRMADHDPHWSIDGERAAYLYSFALTDAVAGQGRGQQILLWLKSNLHGQYYRYLRLDCMAGNSQLRHYYEAQAFVYRGEMVDGDYRLAMVECDLTTHTQQK